jgi:GNAT superfamily N-acetyltransferase
LNRGRVASVDFTLADPHGPDAQRCLEQYFNELAARFKEGFDREAGGAAAIEDFAAPTGCFLIANLLGRPVGCGAIRTLAPGIGEIKRMWVSPQARGLGLGRRLLQELELSARTLKLHTVRLDTNASLGEAVKLYLASGYREITRFNDNPYAHHWFQKTLT